ncbi:MAG: D-alanine--D-alanine ligase [Candidatus Sumerlaeia bacterium]|nr:D-alanine--D-alanine ligase [Candidatus Sumerlaeia bacterium]
MKTDHSTTKRRIAVLCGGQSGEHEISLLSARSIIQALDRNRYEIFLVGIHKNGQWCLQADLDYLLHQSDPKTIHLGQSCSTAILSPDPGVGGLLVLHPDGLGHSILKLDVVFPVLHGPRGEDGTVQGLLELSGIPYVGAGVVGSAVGMDKDVMKRLLRDAGIPTPRFLVLHHRLWVRDSDKCKHAVWENFHPPVFVKPANLGSSIGITKVKMRGDLAKAVETAFEYDTKIIVEENIPHCRELECSVMGNDDPIASAPGEVIPSHEFYSYEAKYLDDEGARLEIPANLPEGVAEQVQNLAIAAYRALCCEGMGRVDFFLTRGKELFVSEINTIPGFTAISMYPKLWDAAGISFPQLIDRLVNLAIERCEQRKRLRIGR